MTAKQYKDAWSYEWMSRFSSCNDIVLNKLKLSQQQYVTLLVSTIILKADNYTCVLSPVVRNFSFYIWAELIYQQRQQSCPIYILRLYERNLGICSVGASLPTLKYTTQKVNFIWTPQTLKLCDCT